MPLFNFDFDIAARRKAAAEAKALEDARAAYRAVMSRGGSLPRAPDDLAGVTGTDPLADLAAEIRNEEAARAAQSATSAYDADLADAMVGLRAAGVDATGISEQVAKAQRFRALLEAARDLPAAQRVDALNQKGVDPYRANESGVLNRYTGDLAVSDASKALAEQRRAAVLASEAAAGNSDAAAALSRARTAGVDRQNAVIESVLGETQDPLLKLDVVTGKKLSNPTLVRVRRKDGGEALYNAVPNLNGGFDYSPAIAGGDPLVAAPGGESDGRTALQRDTAFIADTLKLSEEDALRWKLLSKRKAPGEAWAELVGRVTSAHKYDPPEKIREDAEALWAIARPGEPVPVGSPAQRGAGPGPAPEETGSPEADDARARAQAEGYSNFGSYVPGKGLEVKDATGRVIGHYY